jgi:hypothetical protein
MRTNCAVRTIIAVLTYGLSPDRGTRALLGENIDAQALIPAPYDSFYL